MIVMQWENKYIYNKGNQIFGLEKLRAIKPLFDSLNAIYFSVLQAWSKPAEI